MIIAITAKEGSLQSEVDPRFGRAAFYLIANSQTGEVHAVENTEGVNAANGAGTGAAQLMAENRVDVLFTGKVGPKASEVLQKVGIKVHENTSGTVEMVLDGFATDIGAQSEAGGQVETVEAPHDGALRLAVPADSDEGLKAPRSGHFGKCAYYILVDIKDNQIQQVIALKNGGHVTGGCFAPVMLLQGNHVGTLIVGGIGGRPLQGFRQVGIEVLSGGGRTVGETVELFLNEQIAPITNDQVCGGGA